MAFFGNHAKEVARIAQDYMVEPFEITVGGKTNQTKISNTIITL